VNVNILDNFETRCLLIISKHLVSHQHSVIVEFSLLEVDKIRLIRCVFALHEQMVKKWQKSRSAPRTELLIVKVDKYSD